MHLFAYLDAGTGSLFIQAVLGTVLAGVVIMRVYVNKAMNKLKLVLSKQGAAEEQR